MAVAMLLTLNSWRQELRAIVRGSWTLLAAGVFGIVAIIQQLLPQGDIDANKAWNIYVYFRVPHHVLPSAWQGEVWIIELILATGIFLVVFLTTKKEAEKFTAAYALGSVGLFGVGMAIYALGYTSLLRFYWFRYPDVMIPLLGLLFAALIPDRLTKIDFSIRPRIPKSLHWIQQVLQWGLPLLFAIVAILLTLQSLQFLRAKYYRGKSRPQPAGDILEWYERIQLSNNNQPPKIPASREELQANFYQLDQESIQQLGDTNGSSYYLGLAGQHLPYKLGYQDDDFFLFAIE